MGVIDTKFTSQMEIELRDYVVKLIGNDKVQNNVRNIINPYELDIFIPDKNIAIEFNGDYWHSNINKHKEYHQTKTIDCAKNGVRLIHIFEYEWVNKDKRDKIKKYLRDILCETNRVYARNTYIQIGEKADVSRFIDENHLNGNTHYSVGYILRDKNTDEILSAITLGKPRFNEDKAHDIYEIIRFVTKSGVTVVGGLSKLMKHIGKHLEVKECISYCDLSKFTGNGYYKSGFKASINNITTPGYVWSDGKSDVLTRYQTTKQKLVKNGLGDLSQTEDEIMENLGYYKIYNSGNLKMTYKY